MSAPTKKLIEVALPLEAINKAAAREKSIRHGHPSTLHLWWARRPLAAARAVIFAQMVDDPSSHPDIFRTEKAQEKERKRLFKIIEELVQWESTTDEEVLQRARDEIWASWRATCAANADHPRAKELFNRNKLPGFHDPFAGGGALPLEAQRLGLEAYASDLNPVAVLINKAMIEIPPKFAGRPPVNPDWQAKSSHEKAANPWMGAQGLAEDVRYYGTWIRDEAEKRIGNLYPKVEVTAEMAKERPDLRPLVGQKLTVIAWLWARTVKSPNPAFANVDVPLVSNFILSSREGKEAYVEPIVTDGSYRFSVRVGKPTDQTVKTGTKSARGANFRCLVSGVAITGDYIKAEGHAKRMGGRLLAIVAEGVRGRIYISPTEEHERAATGSQPHWSPEQEISYDPHSGATYCVLYGLTTFGSLFTHRQLVALTTFSDLIQEARALIERDAPATDPLAGNNTLSSGIAPHAYAEAVTLYLSFVVDKCADYWSSICSWHSSGEKIRSTFGRQAIPMTWDYAEANPFSDSSGNWSAMLDWTWKALEYTPASVPAVADQAAAQNQSISANKVVSSDPPYYDNVPYADLSDFFYVWLRRSLRTIFPHLFTTVAAPKGEELVATPNRHGGTKNAEAFFVGGMTQAMHNLAQQAHPAFPVTIYYAFKQTESDANAETVSTGWETFLDAVIRAGFSTSGTWPIRTELANRIRGTGFNALASSIVIVCRPRHADAPTVTRREFAAALRGELPLALSHLQRSNIAPVDLAQAAIGPGMAVYTRYAKVLDADGKAVSVRDALSLINQTLDEVLADQEGDFDADTRWALAWFEQHGFDAGDYGVAETLSKAKNTSVRGLDEAGILTSKGGKVRLLKPADLPETWDPDTDQRLTVWEIVNHLVRVLEGDGEAAAATLVAKLGAKSEVARELAYRLYALCDRKKRAPLAGSYNALVQSWPEISRLARQEAPKPAPTQKEMF